MSSERFIWEVQKFPQLYDATHEDYFNTPKRQDIWNNICAKIGIPGNQGPKKWKDIRDVFVKGIRKPNSKPYKYNHLLNFLLPHIKARRSSGGQGNHSLSLTDSEVDNAVNDIPDESDKESDDGSVKSSRSMDSILCELSKIVDSSGSQVNKGDQAECSHSKKRKRQSEQDSWQVDKDILSYLQEVRNQEAEDEDDIFFRSMAVACKKLPPRAKSSVKFKIHQIIHEAELETFDQASWTEMEASSNQNQMVGHITIIQPN